MMDPNLVAKLQAENARLIALLDAHGIEWRLSNELLKLPVAPLERSQQLDTDGKLALFRSLFRGRTDVYPIRWESKAGKSGYAPACANEWRPGVCEKPRIKCGDCGNRQLLPLTDEVVYRHLAGEVVVGIYPLLSDDTCCFLAVDFDEAEWRDDSKAFVQSCHELNVPVALEISRSGQGAHGWIFFERNVPACDARRLGAAIISHACERTRQLALSSYDRLFPNQDYMPKGGFGNLIALPLQKRARAQNNSVFVDDSLEPHPDQWAFLASIQRMSPEDIQPVIIQAMGNRDPLGVAYVDDEGDAEPWKGRESRSRKLTCPLPDAVNITLANLIYFEKSELPQPLANQLVRLAAFQNPEFYKAQAMRMSVWNKPRIIGCAQNFPKHIALPRGCLDAALGLLEESGVTPILKDERFGGAPIDVSFLGALRSDQEAAVSVMLSHDTGILCAPTAFGKTVSAAALIAARGINTLVLVHRTELLRQWQERLQAFLGVGNGVVGTLGGGKAKLTGIIDIAVMQSLSRKGEISDQVKSYGQIIVDECHHLSAVSFEALLRSATARYVLGLTATPVRRDGQQPIIFMQCGPIRHSAARPTSAPHDLSVVPRLLPKPIVVPEGFGIQDVFRRLADDSERTAKIVSEIELAYNEGRKILVLTERTEHVDALELELKQRVHNLFTLHGRVPKKQRISRMHELESLPPDAPRVLLATGKLVGEGFDHPPLDTLVLAMPISWKGILQQYAGRLHRSHADKADVRVIDFVDVGNVALMRMWDKRRAGYKAMGYRMADSLATMDLL
ncbi:DEAD/DEAH box helicase family protein [Pseudomonas syringae pv. actinidiae]|nr:MULTISPECIES: DEAD/DEAH box helicase [Pseudomonas syringae group]MBM0212737.1 DEAD/DEAH box helicase [Pseudomonas syringae pv. maculicola]MDU8265511.1 DEAD/DEAH box helicase family protein [Pseudomonas syringae pv. actinidiae]MDU8282013.1 DEAD/DEAH box helicase family protein [Pseudomonas syringae pv. actinidiae]MDU8302876.1 DEAD/DEAH box helicase family protein [Pseudomonas syringae pv. actinidiae]OSN35977.1 putative DNA repair helicase RadD [Pseudomonas syringae pv. actinidiae]